MKREYFIVLALSVIILFSSLLSAQERGAIIGKVMDNKNEPLPGATVTIFGTSFFAITDVKGNYTIANIPEGIYKVTAKLEGFRPEIAEEVKVVGKTRTRLEFILTPSFFDQIVVTARRDETIIQELPINLTVISLKDIEAMPIQNVYGALNNTVGVDVATNAGYNNIQSLSIHGYEDRYIKKMVDGIDFTQTVESWSLLNSFPQEVVERIEIIRGGTSSSWGSNFGGILNIITKDPVKQDRPTFNLTGNFGKWGAMDFSEGNAIGESGSLAKIATTISGSVDKFGYLGNFEYSHNSGYIENHEENSRRSFAKLSYAFTDFTTAEVMVSYNKLFGDSGRMFLYLPGFNEAPFYYWNYYFNQDLSTKSISGKVSHIVGPKLTFFGKIRYFGFEGDMTNYNLGDFYEPEPYSEYYHWTDSNSGLILQGAYTPTESSDISFGFDYAKRQGDFTMVIPEGEGILSNKTYSPFMNIQQKWNRFIFHAGLRMDFEEIFPDQYNPSLGVVVNFGKASLVRFNVARAFQDPDFFYLVAEAYTIKVLPNPDLQPENGWMYGFGFESQELSWLFFRFDAYYDKLHDYISMVSSEDQPGRLTWANIGDSTKKGIDTQIGVMPFTDFKAYVGINYNRHYNIEGQVNEWIPTRSWKIGANYYNPTYKFGINMNGRNIWWNVKEFEYLFLPEDRKWLVDVRISKDFEISPSTGLTIFSDIFNLLNVDYWDRIDSPNLKRWIDFGFKINFK